MLGRNLISLLGVFSLSLCLIGTPASAQSTGPQKGDVIRGAEAYEALCTGCHEIDANKVGPLHRGLIGRRVGSAEGFKYSDALASSKLVWDAALLDAWLTDPEKAIKGQRMNVRINKPETRANLIAYLSTQKAKS